jgi:anti-sigma B factor antagonist
VAAGSSTNREKSFAFSPAMRKLGRMASEYLLTQIDKATVVEFRIPSLMDPVQLEMIQKQLFQLVDEQDKRLVILDFSKVEFLSSQAIGIVIGLHRRLSTLPHSQLLLCGVNGKLIELLRITRLDKVLKVKPTQKEAINSLAML